MNFSEQKANLIKALVEARKVMSSGAKKNAKNPHLKSNYANLESFLDAIRPALEANGLIIIQNAIDSESLDVLKLETTIMHESGEYMSSVMPMPVAKKDAQGYGSAMTYARRYSIASMFGIAQSDDDGNAARKSPKDAANLIRSAATMEELTAIYGDEYKAFRGDDAATRVIVGAYQEMKAKFMVSGGSFDPAKLAKPQPQQEQHPEPQTEHKPTPIEGF
ncbi:ERF superfamily protein [Citrobacter phage vB_CfrS_K1M]